jgi:hypothetical protein
LVLLLTAGCGPCLLLAQELEKVSYVAEADAACIVFSWFL